MMKRLAAWLLVLAMFIGTPAAVFAAGETRLGSDGFYSEVSGKYTVVTKTVEGNSKTYKITGYYYPNQGKEVFRLINKERAAAGESKLTWEDELVQPAIQRALEQYLAKSHTRPNGEDGVTVSKLAHGENLAGGYLDAFEVMDAWMSSPGHKKNILDADYTSVAVACVGTDEMCFWVQLFHAGKPSGTSSEPGSEESEAAGSEKAKSVISELNKAKTTAKNVSVTLKDEKSISPAVLKAMSDWGAANKKTVFLKADTTGDNGKGVQGRMTLSPSGFAAIKNDLKPGVRVDKASTSAMLKNFEAWYRNKVSIIKLDHTGDFAADVNITAKADLTGLDTENLVFYSYNPSTNKIVKLAVDKDGYSIDNNKYLHFTTNKGGYIVVTDKELAKR